MHCGCGIYPELHHYHWESDWRFGTTFLHWLQPKTQKQTRPPSEVLVSKCLYSFIGHVTHTESTCLDHCFHTIALSIPDTHTTHIDKRFHSIDSEILQHFPERYLFRWRAEKAQAYTAQCAVHTLKGKRKRKTT
eukprot:1145025-Pelagomonas_calceolata.AAC.4